LAAVERGADNSDAIAAALDLSGGEAAALLADLETHGYVNCDLLGTYTRSLLQAP
jgi:DNA-binding IclR family transcriptional regulator